MVQPAVERRDIEEAIGRVRKLEERLENYVNRAEARERPVIHGLRNLARNVGLGAIVKDGAEIIRGYVEAAQEYIDRDEIQKAANSMARAYELVGKVYQSGLERTADGMSKYRDAIINLRALEEKEKKLKKEANGEESAQVKRIVLSQIEHVKWQEDEEVKRMGAYHKLAQKYDLLRASADEAYKRADQFLRFVGEHERAHKVKRGYVIKSAERTLRSQMEVGGRVQGGAVAIVGVLGGLFFLSPNMTGNVIGGLNQTAGNWIGAVLLVVGLVAGFFWMKGRK